MNKKIMTAITILCCTLLCTMPFSVKAASDLQIVSSGQIGKSNDIIGNFITYNYVPDSTTNHINTDIEGLLTDVYTGGSLHIFTFNDKYYGQFVINITNLSYSNFLYATGDNLGTFNYDRTAGKMYVNLVGCSYFKIYTLSKNTSSSLRTTSINGYNASGIEILDEADNQDIVNAINTLADYNIPQQSLPAYIFASSISNPVVMNPGNYAPYVKVDANGTSRQGKYIKWDANDREATYHFVVIANVVLSSSNVSSLNGNIDLTFNTGIYDFGNYSVTDVEINGKSGTLLNPVSDRLVYGRTIYLYPLFYGRGYDMPDEVRQMLGWDTKQNQMLENSYELNAWVAEIANYLISDNSGTSDNVDDTTDAVIDLQDQEHDITEDFAGSLTDFNTNMNLNDYNFTSIFMDANNYFKNQLDLMYTESSSFAAYFIIPIILIILTVLLGR